VAQFGPTSTAAAPVVTFTQYGSQPIPTTLRLPCYGTSSVLFRPVPTSATARSTHVSVRFVPTCLSVACPVTSGPTRAATRASSHASRPSA
jgi:hypothetical protein